MVFQSLENLEKSGSKICVREKLENLEKSENFTFRSQNNCSLIFIIGNNAFSDEKNSVHTSKLQNCVIKMSGNFWNFIWKICKRQGTMYMLCLVNHGSSNLRQLIIFGPWVYLTRFLVISLVGGLSMVSTWSVCASLNISEAVHCFCQILVRFCNVKKVTQLEC